MPTKATPTEISTSPAHSHKKVASAAPERLPTLHSGPLSANTIVALQRYVGNSGVQRLLDGSVQRKKTIDEDVRINGNLSVSGYVFGYDTVYGKQGLLTDRETITKTLRSDGQADVGGDLYVKGNTHKGSSMGEE
ncbi:MAG: hypothetical protein U0452_05665 [Anaerolineae bacterium]